MRSCKKDPQHKTKPHFPGLIPGFLSIVLKVNVLVKVNSTFRLLVKVNISDNNDIWVKVKVQVKEEP
ncbi:hypothetical protein NUACC21_74230 [Scytonema sp. NUACC21]